MYLNSCSLFTGSDTAVLEAALVSGNEAQGGVYIDPSASATEDMQTLIAGNQPSKNKNDVWGTNNPGP